MYIGTQDSFTTATSEGVASAEQAGYTHATALFERGEHPKKVQALLGHSSITQTMDTYSHLLDDIGGDAVGGLDEAFGGTGTT